MGAQERERAEEKAHGGIASRDGDMATLGDGARWWVNRDPWAHAVVDAAIEQDRARVAAMRQQMRERA
jgi:hypothetical protein